MKLYSDNKAIGFVLSTGRTGTVTITEVLNTCGNVVAMHEPKPSRRFHILSKLYLQDKLKKEILARLYLNARKQILERIQKNYYIEVNPFAWGFGEVFCVLFDNPKILHIVRDIHTYLVSIMNFKAKGWHRYIINYIPFWDIKVNKIIKDIDDWNSLTFEEKVAWRWVLMNKTIDENEKYTPNYLRVRFEDIFTQDEEVQKNSLKKITNFFDIQLDIKKCSYVLRQKFNPSRKISVSSFESFDKKLQDSILDITTPLREKYGYVDIVYRHQYI